ncbi:hypothetical protein, partial [Enterococcus faecium]
DQQRLSAERERGIARAYAMNALKIFAQMLEEIQLRRKSICVDSRTLMLHAGKKSDWHTHCA